MLRVSDTRTYIGPSFVIYCRQENKGKKDAQGRRGIPKPGMRLEFQRAPGLLRARLSFREGGDEAGERDLYLGFPKDMFCSETTVGRSQVTQALYREKPRDSRA